MINLRQVKVDFDNGVSISRATWVQVLELALVANGEFETVSVAQLNVGDVIVGPGPHPNARSVVKSVIRLSDYGYKIQTESVGTKLAIIKTVFIDKTYIRVGK